MACSSSVSCFSSEKVDEPYVTAASVVVDFPFVGVCSAPDATRMPAIAAARPAVTPANAAAVERACTAPSAAKLTTVTAAAAVRNADVSVARRGSANGEGPSSSCAVRRWRALMEHAAVPVDRRAKSAAATARDGKQLSRPR